MKRVILFVLCGFCVTASKWPAHTDVQGNKQLKMKRVILFVLCGFCVTASKWPAHTDVQGNKQLKMKRVILFVLCGFCVTASKWPAHTDVQDNANYDYIIVGAGTAGSILANRLSEQQGVRVLAIEAGGDPPDEKDFNSLLVLRLNSDIYWNYQTEEDDTAQLHKKKRYDISTGKVLGGSSTINNLYYCRGNPKDYEAWVNATGDQSWSWQKLLPYFKKSEHLEDEAIINSRTGSFHGQFGEVHVTRDLRNSTTMYLKAFHEVGHKIVEDVNGDESLGFLEPFFFLSKGVRQSTAQTFLIPIKNRTNFHVMKNTVVNKILFDDNKNAIGLQCTKSDGSVVNIFAQKEVIVSAGAFNTPKLLMLSGIGPAEHLKSLDIPVISDLPVGDNLQDHIAIILAHTLEETTDTTKHDHARFPLPSFAGYGAVDKSQYYPDYQSYNFIAKNNPFALHLLCKSVFHLDENMCNKLTVAGLGTEILLSVFSSNGLQSRGTVRLHSVRPDDYPKINTGFLTNVDDLDKYVTSVQDFERVTQSSYFQNVNSETLDLPDCADFGKGSKEYWKCYVLKMMDVHSLPCCTSPLGSVLDSRFRVNGVKKLRVVDASSMPRIILGGLHAIVMAIAEKAADLIKEDNA